jgi:hypothetical protein
MRIKGVGNMINFVCHKCGKEIKYDESSLKEKDIRKFHQCHNVTIDRCGFGSQLDRGTNSEKLEMQFCDECAVAVFGDLV